MRNLNRTELEQVALDLELELEQLHRLKQDLDKVNQLIETASPELTQILYENQAYKLQNFYMGCERIFQIVATELNGALPTGANWHKRLLERMAVAHGGRPAVISSSTVQLLKTYLGFRHVVRNIYGYELEAGRVAQLVSQHTVVWSQFATEIGIFIEWLKNTSSQL